MYKIYAILFKYIFLVSFLINIQRCTFFFRQQVIIIKNGTSCGNNLTRAIRTALIPLLIKEYAGQTVLIIWHARDRSRNYCEKCVIWGDAPLEVRRQGPQPLRLSPTRVRGGVGRLRLSPTSPQVHLSPGRRIMHLR